ncbi:hypothetical protein IAU59_000041 [Kwoniella sp. CBS 9459]
MSNKPTYAAIVNHATPDSGVSAQAPASAPAPALGAKGDQAVALGAASSSVTGAGPSDAPPPYSAPSHPAAPQNQPHQTILPPPQHYQQHHLDPESGLVSQEQQQQGWVQPPANVAKSRALRRFWGAFFWAWVIWILVGMLIGGGISDVNSAPPHRHGHWDKHGDWHGDNVDVGVSASGGGGGGIGGDHGAYMSTPTLVQVKERIGGLLPDFASS